MGGFSEVAVLVVQHTIDRYSLLVLLRGQKISAERQNFEYRNVLCRIVENSSFYNGRTDSAQLLTPSGL